MRRLDRCLLLTGVRSLTYDRNVDRLDLRFMAALEGYLLFVSCREGAEGERRAGNVSELHCSYGSSILASVGDGNVATFLLLSGRRVAYDVGAAHACGARSLARLLGGSTAPLQPHLAACSVSN